MTRATPATRRRFALGRLLLNVGAVLAYLSSCESVMAQACDSLSVIDANACTSPRLSAIAGAYLANQRQSELLFLHSLADRGQPAPSVSGDTGRSVWLRAGGMHVDSTAANGSVDARSRNWLVQGGMNLWRGSLLGVDELSAGVFGNYGDTSSDTRATFGTPRVDSSSRGWGGGVYATWREQRRTGLGAYADTWWQYDRFTNDVSGPGFAPLNYDSHVTAAAIEAGYGLRPMDIPWTFEPQGQVFYVHNHMYDVHQTDGTTIQGEKGTGWVYRLGLRMHRDWRLDSGTRLTPSVTFNWWRNHLHDTAILDSSIGAHDLYPVNRYELKATLGADFRNGWTGQGSLAWQTGNQSYSAWAAFATLRYGW